MKNRPLRGGYVSATSVFDDDSFMQDLPVIIFEAEPKGEGGLVPTTVIDPDEEDSFLQDTPELVEE